MSWFFQNAKNNLVRKKVICRKNAKIVSSVLLVMVNAQKTESFHCQMKMQSEIIYVKV